MQDYKIHTRTYKTIIIMLVLMFSLSPCSVKRDLLGIFDIQYISPLNKVRVTSNPAFSCDSLITNSSQKTLISSIQSKSVKGFFFYLHTCLHPLKEGKQICNTYSGTTSGNSPPRYILFQQLKLDIAQEITSGHF
ncbi:hypothetical protein PFY10_20980 [Chryseobacterium daecheongense]|nr:hypothetical protein PFY10_20980 [Chryseobacterium daecheongense]